ncbi:MAG: prephenate dehydrogenase/arogenate dehydrogenase family protein [Candidatus Thermoplasmatota archaeon]
MTVDELEALRAEVDRIDAELIRLISKRADVAREIGLTKRKDGLKVRDPARERKVVEKMARLAASAGADKRLAKEAARLLIADAVAVQRQEPRLPLEGTRALVVGGAGSMGGWTCRFLSNRGAKVRVWDPRGRRKGYPAAKELGPAAAEADIVVVASPLGVCQEELREVLAARPKGLVMDICSIKSHISSTLRLAAADGVTVASVHPMFGPRAPSPKGLNVVVCDCGSREATARARRIFKDSGANVVELYLEEHDRMMAYILGLSHMTALMFGTALRSSGKKASEFREAQGTSFARLAELAKEVSGESRRVYHDIQALNPHTKEVAEAAERALRELREASCAADHDMFIRLMESTKEHMET